ncbi:diguanylate cyclase [Anaerostipes sp. 992a]|uniref:tRNA dihydrouridine synthase n=1 Tax=Anaerostipes sp. 992a TaxID=1261637 RepID=UPI0009513D3E|nr:tRNA-dihydrouridine synthase family protein [Anaerostipes sp. 992a]OLR63334.1 diguanylate cyclase [Anaerostipes sp. 992a]
MKIYLAPMEGITSYIFRNAHHKYFGGIDKYFTPFLAPNQAHAFMPREKRDVLPEHNEGLYVVPQILTNQAEHFMKAAKELKEMGYEEVNLNLGCPSGTVTAKRRGAGFLSDLEGLDDFLDQIFMELDMKISVKTRLGVEDPEEFYQLLEIYNQFPMEELIIHPRVQKDFYKNQPRMEYFSMAVEESKNPVCYNGNIFSREGYIEWKQQCPKVDLIMIGRGAIANPALSNAIRGESNLSKEDFLHFHDEVCQGYTTWMNGDRNVLFKMKELWYYFGCLFPDGKKQLKKIKKCQNLKAYDAAVKELVDGCQMQPERGFLSAV